MLTKLPEARTITAEPKTQAWYMALAANFDARHIGIDPATGFRTIGGYWNLLSAAAGFLNILTITGLTRIIVAGRKGSNVKSIVWLDQIWPWIIAYDLWNHAFLYNSLGDYTWYCSFALLLACTIPAFTWARGQWIWFRCYTLMYWIAFYNWLPTIATPPNAMTNFATMDPAANKTCSWLALIANVALFVYWLYLIIKHKRNPFTEALFMETKAFRRVVKETCDDKEKYFITDCVEKTPEELGFEPNSPFPPANGYVTHYFWWGKKDKRYPKLRTPLSSTPALVKKGIESNPQWDVPAGENGELTDTN